MKALPVAILFFQSGLPNVVGRPATLNDSLTVIEMPCNGPQRSPRASAASAARARSRAWSTCQTRSEEHTSELQSHSDLVCRLLLEKKKKIKVKPHIKFHRV